MNTENPTQIEKSPKTYQLKRMDRGGYWYGRSLVMQASSRDGNAPTYRDTITGFRLVRNK
jgi:formylglycine-generating enzyme required for sulfatase activity